ncbi:MAG: tetratricopeptide repeat protein [Alphaproteobacteria bacterium]
MAALAIMFQAQPIKAAPVGYVTPYVLALEATANNDYDEVQSQLSAVVKQLGDDVPDYVVKDLVLSYFNAGKIENAIRLMRDAEIERHNELTRVIALADDFKNKRYRAFKKDSYGWTLGRGFWDKVVTVIRIQTLATSKDWTQAKAVLAESSIPEGLPDYDRIIQGYLSLQAQDYEAILSLTKAFEDAPEARMDFGTFELFKLRIFALTKLDAHDQARALIDRNLAFDWFDTNLNRLVSQFERNDFEKQINQIQKDTAKILGQLIYYYADLVMPRNDMLGLFLMRTIQLIDPKNPLPRLSIAEYMSSHRHFDLALAMLKEMDRDPLFSAHAKRNMADIYYQKDQQDKAIILLEAVVKANESDLLALERLGNLYRFGQDFDKAVDIYAQTIHQINNRASGDPELDNNLNANLLGYFYYYLGMSYERAGDWPQAEAAFLTGLEYRPKHSDMLNYLGYVWVDMGINIDRATDMIKQAIAQSPNRGHIVDSLGWAYYRLERFDEAAETLEKAIQMLPADPIVNDHLGDAYYRVGRTREAYYQWERALLFDPEPEEKEKIILKLEQGLS